MPIVDGKHYKYTKAGIKAAAKVRKRKKSSKRSYSASDVEAARRSIT